MLLDDRQTDEPRSREIMIQPYTRYRPQLRRSSNVQNSPLLSIEDKRSTPSVVIPPTPPIAASTGMLLLTPKTTVTL